MQLQLAASGQDHQADIREGRHVPGGCAGECLPSLGSARIAPRWIGAFNGGDVERSWRTFGNQGQHPSCTEIVSLLQNIIAKDGIVNGLLIRGLGTKILANGCQGMIPKPYVF